MRNLRRIISVILCACLIFSLTFMSFAKDEAPAATGYSIKASTNNYPYVLVHGMMGWGENAEGEHDSAYWGMLSDKPIAEILREKGFEVAVPTVAPLGSAWDRACELFAQLTGTVVDYGQAHSEKYGHSRFGRDYTGRALLGENGWDAETPVNLVTHSFGGPTGYVFTSMLEYGVEEEKAASPEDCSELFKGGHSGLVCSMTTLESPHNGTTAANLINDSFLPLLLAGVIMNISGSKKDVKTDYMVDQFGITTDPSTDERATFSLSKCLNLATSKDHAGYDMTLKGARELNEKFRQPTGTYLFSVAADFTKAGSMGMRVPADVNIKNPMSLTVPVVSMLASLPLDGGKIPGKDWQANDGLVPVISALHPFDQPYADYKEGTQLERGIWYVLPVVENANHGYGMSGSEEKLQGIWNELTQRVNAANAD